MAHTITRTTRDGWNMIIDGVKKAKKSIDCELFILDIEGAGLDLLNALAQKSREGVKVRLMVDAAASYVFYLATDIKQKLRRDGIQISFFNHFLPWHPRNLTLWYFRNHRRSLIIDHKEAYTGGICFAERMKEWRDTVVKTDDPGAVFDMADAFDRMWDFSEYKKLHRRQKLVGTNWRYHTNAPLPRKYYFYKALIELIKNAEHEIILTTPYFVPDYMFFRALLRAQKRGVTVHLMIPKKSDHFYVDHAGDLYKERLLKHGARIYPYRKTMIHSKIAVVDGRVGVIGSMNLDNVSLRYNFEGGLVITDMVCVKELSSYFWEDVSDVAPLTLTEWHNRPFIEKVLAYLTWPVRKLL